MMSQFSSSVVKMEHEVVIECHFGYRVRQARLPIYRRPKLSNLGSRSSFSRPRAQRSGRGHRLASGQMVSQKCPDVIPGIPLLWRVFGLPGRMIDPAIEEMAAAGIVVNLGFRQ